LASDGVLHQTDYINCINSRNTYKAKISKLDFEGNHIYTTPLPDSPLSDTVYSLEGICATPTGIFAGGHISYYRDDTLRKRTGAVFKMNHQGEILKTIDFGGYTIWSRYISNYIVYKAGYIYWLADHYPSEAKEDIRRYPLVAFKMDTLGNVLWETHLNTHPDYPASRGPVSRYFTVNEQGQMEVCAVVKLGAWGFYTPDIAYAGLIDSSGKIIREYRSNLLNTLEDTLKALRNFSWPYFRDLTGAFGSEGQSVWFIGVNPTENGELWIFGLDSTGRLSLFSSSTYQIQTNYYKIRKMPDGKFIGLFRSREYNYPGADSISQYGSGLISFDETGKVNWCRRYYLPDDKNFEHVLDFYDILQLPNKDLVVSGYYSKTDVNNRNDEESNIFQIGLDSMGCPFAGCTEADSVYIFPTLMIAGVDDERRRIPFDWRMDDQQDLLSLIFDPDFIKQDVHFMLSDISGKVLRSVRIKKDVWEYTEDISNLPTGIYAVGLQSDRIRHGFKFVKLK